MCDSPKSPWKTQKHSNQLLWNFYPTKSVCRASASRSVTFKHLHPCALGMKRFHPLAPRVKLRTGVDCPGRQKKKDGWNLAMCKDYLTLGVVAIRKWLGLEGRGGLTPRDGAGAAAFSALKVFMSCATRPRPAQVGAPPAGPASCGTAFQGTSTARTSGRDRRRLV